MENAIKLSSLKPNPNNPRIIKDSRFKELKKSIEEFPKMMKLRPIVVDKKNIILGGNMRYKALEDLGYKEIPAEWVKQADELTEEERRRFVAIDNVPFGEWDWEAIANEWPEVEGWGMEVPGWIGEEPGIEELIGDEKTKPPTMKITFKTTEQLQKAESDIIELIDRKYQGAFYSVSAGEA